MLNNLPNTLHGSLITLQKFEPNFIPELFCLLCLEAERTGKARTQRPVFAYANNLFFNSLHSMQQGKSFVYAIFEAHSKNLLGAIEILFTNNSQGQIQTWLQPFHYSNGRYQEILSFVLPLYFFYSKKTSINVLVAAENTTCLKAYKQKQFICINEKVLNEKLYLEMIHMLPYALHRNTFNVTA